VSLAG